MTTLQAAAERLRRNYDGEQISMVYTHPYPHASKGQRSAYAVVQRAKDREIIADAYLREHPADEGEPISEEWLKAVGFTRDDESCMLRLYIDLCSYNSTIVIGCPVCFAAIEQVDGAGPHDSDDDSCVQIPFPQTRRDVRRLAAALGITLKETP